MKTWTNGHVPTAADVALLRERVWITRLESRMLCDLAALTRAISESQRFTTRRTLAQAAQ